MMRSIKVLHKSQKGVTGLETAIILIAFIMVASVFAYVVLSAGLFSAQKAKESINTGLQESSGSVKIVGNVYAKMVVGYATEIYINLATVSSGTPNDFTDTADVPPKNKVIITYTDNYVQYTSLPWVLTKLATNNNDNLLDKNELFLITIDVSGITTNAGSEEEKMGAYHQFTLEIKPPSGATLAVERTLPGRVDAIVNLY